MKKILIFLFILFQSPIFSDILYLKNNQKYEGLYISEDKESVTFRIEMKENRVFDKKDIKNIDLESTGIDMEFSTVEEPKNKKKGVLYSIDKEKAILILEGSKGFELVEIPVENIYRLKAKKNSKKDIISRVVKPDAPIAFGIKNSKDLVKGKVHSVEGNEIKIDSSTGIQEVSEMDIVSIDIDNRPPKPVYKASWDYLTYLVPGYKQFWRDSTYEKVKGGTMFTTFLVLVALIPYRYNMAEQARANDYDFVPIGGRVYFFQNMIPSNAYMMHAQAYNMAIGALVALYAYHALDIYLDMKEQKKQELVKIKFNPLVGTLHRTQPFALYQPPPHELEIKFLKHF